MIQAFLRTCRLIIRRMITLALGAGATRQLHTLYHAVLRRTGGFGLNETAATKALLSLLAARAGTILDGGANIGRYSWFMARYRDRETHIYGFEPNPDACRLARRNLAGLKNVTLLPVGLAETQRTGSLVVPQDAFGNPVSGLGFVASDPEAAGTGPTEPISLWPLDALIADGTVRIQPPVLLKLDIEGYEPAALAGMARLLDQHRPWMFFECDTAYLARAGYDWDAVYLPLRNRGYVIFAEIKGRFYAVEQPQSASVNYFALPLPSAEIPPAAGWTIDDLQDRLSVRPLNR